MSLQSFADRNTAATFVGLAVRALPHGIQSLAMRKLAMLHQATRLEQLMIPPANRLERLKGTRAGQYSIRINAQWRICFRWDAPHAFDVEICDYHR